MNKIKKAIYDLRIVKAAAKYKSEVMKELGKETHDDIKSFVASCDIAIKCLEQQLKESGE